MSRVSRARRYLPLHMTRDDRPALIDRRKASCAKLDVCCDRWIDKYGAQGARCPDRCYRFVRAERRQIEQVGGGGIVMAGASL